MRVLIAVAVIAHGIAGINAASAADISIDRSASDTRYSAVGQRAEQFVIYDDQPGVFVRAYWLAPWRHRHYFPATGHRPPASGRGSGVTKIFRPSAARRSRRKRSGAPGRTRGPSSTNCRAPTRCRSLLSLRRMRSVSHKIQTR
jgi:hypothetical protein